MTEIEGLCLSGPLDGQRKGGHRLAGLCAPILQDMATMPIGEADAVPSVADVAPIFQYKAEALYGPRGVEQWFWIPEDADGGFIIQRLTKFYTPE